MVGIAYNLLTPIVDFNNIYVYLGMYNTYLTYFYGSMFNDCPIGIGSSYNTSLEDICPETP